jgi:TPR repeat
MNPKDCRQMKYNLCAVLGTTTLLLTAKVQFIQAAPMPLMVQHPTSSTPVLLSQAATQDVGSDRTQPKESAVSMPLVLGSLGILLIAAGSTFWYVRTRVKNQRVEGVRQQIRDVRQPPVAGQQSDEASVPEISQLIDIPEIPVLTKQVPDLWEVPISNPAPLELLTKVDTLQQEINSVKQRFERIGHMLEQEVRSRLQVLPNSISSPLPPERLLEQQQALNKLEVLQSLTDDLKLPPEGYFKVGNALFYERRLEDAIASYDKAIELNPDAAFAWFNTAYIYSLQGDVVKSARYLAQAIHLDPACSVQAKKHTGFDPVRGDERFKELLQDG